MAIPDFIEETGYLPEGLHQATIDEIRQKLGFSTKRKILISNLEQIASDLFQAGVKDLRIDGSFVTEKPEPGDIDGFWVMEEPVVFDKIPPILRDFSRIRDPNSSEIKFPMWFKYQIELYIHPHMGGFEPGDFPYFFSHSRDGVPRGYIQVLPDRLI